MMVSEAAWITCLKTAREVELVVESKRELMRFVVIHFHSRWHCICYFEYMSFKSANASYKTLA